MKSYHDQQQNIDTTSKAYNNNKDINKEIKNLIDEYINVQEKELENLLPAINEPERPLTVILGGSKVSDKIGVIENLVKINFKNERMGR